MQNNIILQKDLFLFHVYRNGMSYAGEIHFVYRNLDTQQIAVLGIFMRSISIRNATQNNTIGLYDAETRQEWLRYFDIAQTLQKENNSVIFSLNLALLMGENLTDFWRYQGSLTTPPCTEGIIWTLFKNEIIFIESEFQSFRQNISFEDYRHPQPLFTRTIYRNFLNETISSIPDYNCCPGKGQNVVPDGFTSSFRKLCCSKYLIFLILFIAL
jgi:carbonic anhydrase